ncbi:hypothetical protein [Streptomyces bauhiniae]|uniref:PQQ-binding-like beta-propeller repeat protein n=1 Tax=Streptomyces bauhiniae TaxID=2340725 RepID=A0A7K3QNK4_9ACTN|nr:hypothetical protein [Streptomyces bauhiniae]NEB91340.1 hypothetical protein [Streptomyces bauhiniae]
MIYFATTTGKTKWALALPGTEDRAVRGIDGSVTARCRGALVRRHPETRDLQPVAGGFGGYATLQAGRDGALWVYNQVGGLASGSVTISRIGERPGAETRHDIPFPNGMRAVHLADERHSLSGTGHSTAIDVSKSPSSSEEDWIASAVPDPRAATGSDEHIILVASIRSSLDESLQSLDLRKALAWTELLTFTANWATDLTVKRTGALSTSSPARPAPAAAGSTASVCCNLVPCEGTDPSPRTTHPREPAVRGSSPLLLSGDGGRAALQALTDADVLLRPPRR